MKIYIIFTIFIHVVVGYIQERIVGGNTAEPDQFPYHIQLRRNAIYRCGGAILDAQWILTSADCVNGVDANTFTVLVGSIKYTGDGGTSYDVEKTFRHPHYGMFKNDIGLVKVQGRIEFNDFVQPIEIADERPAAGTNAIITGYGLLLDPT